MISHSNEMTDQLEQSIGECRRLANDIDRMIDDIDRLIQEWEVRYAVDWSEIRAYVDPDSSVVEMKIFSDDGDDISRANQNAVVNTLLFGLNRKPVLLAPYAVEFQSYMSHIRRLERQSPGSVAERLKTARNEVDQLLNSDEGKNISELVTRIRHDPQSVGDDDLHTIVDYVEANVGNLITLLQRGVFSPREIVDGLLRRRPFDDLSALSPQPARLDPSELLVNEQTAERWESELKRRRGDRVGPNYRDAYVMMLLEAVNAELEKSKTRLCLVTRSEHMHAIMEDETEKGLWGGKQGNLLRHPRSFVASQARGFEDLQQRKERLEALRASIRAFVDATWLPEVASDSEWAPLNKLVRNSRARAAELLEAIKHDWRTLVSLVAADAWAPDAAMPPTPDRGVGLELILELFSVVHDPGVLKAIVRDRIEELIRTIDFNYQYLAAFVHGQAAPQEISAQVGPGPLGVESMSIDAPAYFAPYAVTFHSPPMVAWSQRVQARQQIDLQEILDLFADGFVLGHTYEPLLAIAYFFGALDRWPAARDFADLAAVAHAAGDPPPVDGYLLQAISLRRVGERSVESYREALRLIDDAMSLTDDRDPRMFAEKASQLFYWSIAIQRLPNAEDNINNGISLFERALELLGDRDDDVAVNLKLKIHNNRCYYLVNLDDDRFHERADDDLRQMVEILASREPDQTKWRPVHVDTILWAEWHLHVKHLDGEQYVRSRNELIEKYERLRSRDLTLMGRAMVDAHIRAIRDASR